MTGMTRIWREALLSAPPPHRFVESRPFAVSRFQLRKLSPTKRFPGRRRLGEGGNASTLERLNAFTLLELLILMGIVALLMVLIAPAFTTIKGGGDVTSAAYTIKGVLDTARTYAKANNTYTWVGFYEEDVSQPSTNPPTMGVGRVVMSIVASKDGTNIYNPTNPAKILTTKLIQVGKLAKIDNAHLTTFTLAPVTPTGSTFDDRPAVTYRIGSATPPDSLTPFQYPVGDPEPHQQYSFVKAVQFSPRGEARINNSTVVNGTEVYPMQAAAEIGLAQTHGNVAPTLTVVNGKYVGNMVAIQFAGFSGAVRIYRK